MMKVILSKARPLKRNKNVLTIYRIHGFASENCNFEVWYKLIDWLGGVKKQKRKCKHRVNILHCNFFVYARSYQNMTFDFGLSTIAIFRSLFSEKKFLFYFCTVKCVLCSFYPCNNHISFDSMYVNSSPLIVKNTNFKKKDFSVWSIIIKFFFYTNIIIFL